MHVVDLRLQLLASFFVVDLGSTTNGDGSGHTVLTVREDDHAALLLGVY
jgi:hypothetical protein